MGNIDSSASTATAADHAAWASGDSGPIEERRISPVSFGSTRHEDNPHLPAPRAARVAGTGLIEHTGTALRRPVAQLPHLQQESSQDQSLLYRLPDELMIKIGEHLLNLPESSSLKSAALTSRRMCRVFVPFRDQSMRKFVGDRAQFMRQLRRTGLADSEGPRSLFLWTRASSPQLRSYLVHDAIDHVDNSNRSDREKSLILVALLDELPNLIAQSELPSVVARLIPCHNRLAAQEKGNSLVAIARVIKKFPSSEASEPWIAGLTHSLATQKDKLSPELRRTVICELADLTGLVSDDKKPMHILNVLSLIGGLNKDQQPTCYFHLEPYKEYMTVRTLGGVLVGHFGQKLAKTFMGFFRGEQQP